MEAETIQLIEEYNAIFAEKKNQPEWAVHKKSSPNDLVHCTVPFVGKEYSRQQAKFLIYASAEVLNPYDGYLDSDTVAINRHRDSFDSSTKNGNEFFPNVHIQPINDGSLALAALYIFSKYAEIDDAIPSGFYEKIAFGNYCKYTIEAETNIDYAGNKDKLRASREYIACDINILKPNYIIMPSSTYRAEKKFIDEVKGEAKVIPIYQINARNVNCVIAQKYPAYDKNALSHTTRVWYEHLNANGIIGKTKENYLAVFSYLDEILAL